MTDVYREIVEVMNKGEDAAVVTVVSAGGSTPREEGAKMLVKTDGSIVGTVGGGAIEKVSIKEALQVIQTGKAKKLDYTLREGGETGMICGGNVQIFIEPILSLPTIFMCGGGHIGLALSKIARILGYKMVVIDDRAEYANPERFPEVEGTYVDDFSTIFGKLKVARWDYIVIATHGHRFDQVALENALRTEARYVGMIGSKAKIKAVFDHLKGLGFSKEQLDQVHTPIGLEIHAQTPEEIAISIMAEIIAVRRAPVKN